MLELATGEADADEEAVAALDAVTADTLAAAARAE